MQAGQLETSRRAILGVAIAGAASVALPFPARAAEGDWQLRWAPTAQSDGMAAWEHVSADRSHAEGQPHVYPDGDNWRFNMHAIDRDLPDTDKQRQEVAGCRTGDTYLRWEAGSTWRLTYSMYLPSSLLASVAGTHVLQIKNPGPYLPIVLQSLRLVKGEPTIELRSITSNTVIGRTALTPLYDKWTDFDLRLAVGGGKSGAIRWILTSGGNTVINEKQDGIDTLFKMDRVFPRWGIYRSVDDPPGPKDCYMLLTNPRAYQPV